MSSRRAELFPAATGAEWGDWRWQLRHAVRGLEALERAVPLTEEERAGVRETAGRFRLGISPYYLSLVDPAHPLCPVRMQAIPVRAEARVRPGSWRTRWGRTRRGPRRRSSIGTRTGCC